MYDSIDSPGLKSRAIYIEEMGYYHLTFVTKYSRIPQEGIAMQRYKYMIEIGRKPIIIKSDRVNIVRQAIRKKMDYFGVKIICMAILPDHVHIVFYTFDSELIEIIKQVKGYSSYMYFRSISDKKIKGRENTLRATGYSLHVICSTRYLTNTVNYVSQNHTKHESRRGKLLLLDYKDESDGGQYPQI